MKQSKKYYLVFIILLLSSINVLAQNNAPMANTDIFYTYEATPLYENVLLNDTDLDGDSLAVNPILVLSPVSGLATINLDGSFTYTPTMAYLGVDSFKYVVCDNGAPSYCDTGSVYINVGTITVNNVSVTDPVDCQTNNGSIVVGATSSLGILEYSVDNRQTWQASDSFSNLQSGSYYLELRSTITSTEIEYHSNPIQVIAPNSTVIDSFQVSPPNACDNNGTIELYASGGTGNYEYGLFGSFMNSPIFILDAGEYMPFIVRNTDGTCPYILNRPVALVPQGGFAFSNNTITPASSCDTSDGAIHLNTIADNNIQVFHSIDNGQTWQTSSSFTGLGVETYSITSRDQFFNCIQTNTFEITSLSMPLISSVISVDPSNCMFQDGSIVIAASGDTTLQYSINGGDTWKATSLII